MQKENSFIIFHHPLCRDLDAMFGLGVYGCGFYYYYNNRQDILYGPFMTYYIAKDAAVNNKEEENVL